MKKILIALVVVSVAFVGLYSTADNANALYRVPSRVDAVSSKIIVPNITQFYITNSNSYCLFSTPTLRFTTKVRFSGITGASHYNVYKNGVKIATVDGSATYYTDVFPVSSNDSTYFYKMTAYDSYGRLIGVSNVSSIFVPGDCAYIM